MNSSKDNVVSAKTAPKMSSLVQRTISWLILVTSITVALVFFPHVIPYFIAAITSFMFFEWVRIFTKKNILITAIFCALPFLSIMFDLVGVSQAILAWAAVNAVIILVRRNFNTFQKASLFIGGQLYIGLSSLAVIAMYTPELLLGLIAVVVLTDTGAFIGGKLIGGPKLARKISPNKTWSGFVCGLIVCVSGMWGLNHYIDHHTILSANHLVILLLSICAQIGDLLESACKRYFNIKDTGNIIPGHGGIIDRTDSFLAVSLVFYIVMILN